MKKHFRILAVLFSGLYLSISPLGVHAANFSDTNSSIYKESIYLLQGKKIIQGYDDGSFRPENQINRAEFLKILIGSNFADELERGDYKRTCFADIPSAYDWYTPYACLAKSYGIIKGYDGNLLKPAQNINFVEAAKIITNVYENGVKESPTLWYKNYVKFMVENKLIPPLLTKFDHEITRGEMAEMIARVIKRDEGKLEGYLEFRKNKYGESTLPTWESLSGEQSSSGNTDSLVVDIPHPGTFVGGQYISDYSQWINADYDPGENNNKISTSEKTSIKTTLLTKLNQERSAAQKVIFTKNSLLEIISQEFAEHLVANAFYSHTNLFGEDPFDRVATAGYDGFVAESIVWRSDGATDAISWWKNSDIHWNNIMREDFVNAGIGVVKEPNNGYIIVLMTGA